MPLPDRTLPAEFPLGSLWKDGRGTIYRAENGSSCRCHTTHLVALSDSGRGSSMKRWDHRYADGDDWPIRPATEADYHARMQAARADR